MAYQSFLVRAWFRNRHPIRVLVEEVQSGRRSELRGDRAARLVAEIDRLLPPELAGAGVAPPDRSENGR